MNSLPPLPPAPLPAGPAGPPAPASPVAKTRAERLSDLAVLAGGAGCGIAAGWRWGWRVGIGGVFAGLAAAFLARAVRRLWRKWSASRPFRPNRPSLRDRRACANKPPNPKISVVVASYNYRNHLPQTLDSLLAQTYRNFEVVVVDDGSTDGSAEVVRQYAARAANVSLHRHAHGENRGLTATVRRGIEQATGDYVAFCESDDYWSPDHLEKKVEIVRSFRDPVWIANDVQPFGDPDRCAQMEAGQARRVRTRCRRTINRFSPEEFRCDNWVLTFSCCMAKRAALLALDFDGNPWPPMIDWWLWRQLAARQPLFYVDRKLTFWRLHRSYIVQSRTDADAQSRRDQLNRFRLEMDRILARQYPARCGRLLKNPLPVQPPACPAPQPRPPKGNA